MKALRLPWLVVLGERHQALHEALILRQYLDKAQLSLDQLCVFRNLKQGSSSQGILNDGKQCTLECLLQHSRGELEFLMIQVLLEYLQKTQYLLGLLLPLLFLPAQIPFLIGRAISTISHSFLLDQLSLEVIPCILNFLLDCRYNLILFLHLVNTVALHLLG